MKTMAITYQPPHQWSLFLLVPVAEIGKAGGGAASLELAVWSPHFRRGDMQGRCDTSS